MIPFASLEKPQIDDSLPNSKSLEFQSEAFHSTQNLVIPIDFTFSPEENKTGSIHFSIQQTLEFSINKDLISQMQSKSIISALTQTQINNGNAIFEIQSKNLNDYSFKSNQKIAINDKNIFTILNPIENLINSNNILIIENKIIGNLCPFKINFTSLQNETHFKYIIEISSNFEINSIIFKIPSIGVDFENIKSLDTEYTTKLDYIILRGPNLNSTSNNGKVSVFGTYKSNYIKPNLIEIQCTLPGNLIHEIEIKPKEVEKYIIGNVKRSTFIQKAEWYISE